MKFSSLPRFFQFFSLLFCLAPAAIFSQGMEFNHDDWAAVLQKSKAENKLIFMDAFTTWCGPCKMMTKQTFPDATVGAFFNANFINVKMDMEKGEGIDLAKKYEVNLYPTLLFIDGDGAVVHRVAGFFGPVEFLELGKTATTPEKRLGNLDARYKNGERSPEFLLNYLEVKGQAFDPAVPKIAEEYLETQGDLGSEKNMEVIFNFVGDPYSRGFQYFTKNKKQFEDKFGVRQVAVKIEDAFGQYLAGKPEMTPTEIEKLFLTIYPEEGARMASAYKMTAARQAGDRAGFAAAALAHYKKYPSNDADELNEVAWTFYKVVEDQKQLKTAVKWAKKSAKLRDAYFNNDTLAALYFKLKKKKSAIKYAQKAIEMAKSAGEDYGSTQELLDKIYQL